MPDEFTFEAGGRRCIAVRSDRAWGNGLKVNIVGDEDQVVNVITFACYPELPGYEILQAMNTEQLVGLAASQLSTAELDNDLVEARKVNLQLYVAFKVPTG